MRFTLYYVEALTQICLMIIFNARSASAAFLSKREAVTDWNEINPSATIDWVPCFGNYFCTKLQVPLDYAKPDIGTTAIAFLKLPAGNNEKGAPNIIINNGGPGESGVAELLSEDSTRWYSVFGNNYNIIGMDPRGINNSGPHIDCFANDSKSRSAFNQAFLSEVTDASSISLSTQYAAATIWGQRCTAALRKENYTGQYVSTPAVAQDLLSFFEAEAKAAGTPEDQVLVNFYAASYGTAIGTTFAAMWPQRVGKFVLDGVVDAEDYYTLAHKQSLVDADAAMETFATSCFAAGRQNCSFWGPSSQDITQRLDGLLKSLKDGPIPVSGLSNDGSAGLATYSALKQLAFAATYSPITSFPVLADVLSELEQGNGSSLLLYGGNEVIENSDAAYVVGCVDGYGSDTNFTSLQSYADWVEFVVSQSKYFGDAWATNAAAVLCHNLELDLPRHVNGSYGGPLPPAATNTSFPILFTSNTIDPATPIKGARKMHAAFPGSLLLIQNATGHGATLSAGACLIESIQEYLAGNLTGLDGRECQPSVLPFQAAQAL